MTWLLYTALGIEGLDGMGIEGLDGMGIEGLDGQLGHSRHHLSYPILFYPILVEGEFYPKFLRSLEF
jgi:hypothetical protein